MKSIYFDNAATTPVLLEVVEAALPYLTRYYGNPSSLHHIGEEARKGIEEVRAAVAGYLGAQPEEIVFTSGGTESDNLALKGVAYARREKKNHIIVSSVEHHAILETCRFLQNDGFEVSILPVDRYGQVDPDEVKKSITPKTVLVSVMHANNEVGTIQPVSAIGEITREAGVYFHTDAVQTVGHIPVDVNELGVDLLSLSGHKFNGPKGVGALYVRKGTRIRPVMNGGGQERGLRGSTHNVPGIIGLGKALELAQHNLATEMKRVTELREYLIKGILDNIDQVKLNGHPVNRIPNNINVSLAFIEGEATLLLLDAAGICASTGSACSSDSSEASHVLTAMQIPAEEARCSLRFSLGVDTTRQEIDYLLDILPGIVTKLRKMSPLYCSQVS